MRKLISLFLFLPLLSVAATPIPSTFPYKCLGGSGENTASVSGFGCSVMVPVTDTTWFSLYTGALSVGNAAVYPLYRGMSAAGVSTSAAYQVPAAKVLECVQSEIRVGSATGGWQLMSDTVVFAAAATTASLTAPTYQCGAAAVWCQTGHQTANTVKTEGFTYRWSASVFPGAQFADNTQHYSLKLLCREYTP